MSHVTPAPMNEHTASTRDACATPGHATGKVDTLLFWTVKERHFVVAAAMAMFLLFRGSFVLFLLVLNACSNRR